MKTHLKLFNLLSMALLVLIAIHAAYAQEPDSTLEEIRRAIEEKGYDWQADETSVSRLSEEEQRRLLGARLDKEKALLASLEAQEQGTTETFSYPSSVDWSSSVTPVKNQENCGSCVAFATLGAIEGRYKIQNNSSLDLSEAHIFYCGGGQCDYGWYPSDGMNFAANTGVADEPCFPYVDYDVACNPCSDWASRVTKIDNWWGTADTSQMKQALADSGPIELTMDVYEDFLYYSGGVYRHTSGSAQGGHAVCAVGYDDSGGYWIVKNSWGTGWGESGYFKIAYGECDIDGYAYIPELTTSQVTYSIAGYVRDASNQGIAGVVVTVSDRGTATTDSNGYYQKTNIPSGSYTVTPNKPGCQFTPSSKSVTVTSSDVSADFTGKCSASGYSVSGYVRDINGQGLSGINVQVGDQGTVTTNNSGLYVKTNVPEGTYTVTPGQTGCTFDPSSRTVTVSGSDATVPDFLGTCVSSGYKIYLPAIRKDKDNTYCEDTQVIQNGDFESGDVVWTQSSGQYFVIGQYYSYSGDWSAWLGGYDNADDRLYQSFSTHPGSRSARLIFHLCLYSTDIQTSPYDYFHTELQNSSGATLEDFLWADNTMDPGWYEGMAEWADFSAYAGQTLRLFFQGTTDGSAYTNFFVDDVNLYVYCGSLPASGKEKSAAPWEWKKVDALPDLLPAAAQNKQTWTSTPQEQGIR